MGRKSDFFLCTPAQLAPSQPGSAFWLPDRWLHKSTCAAGSGQRRRRKSPITRHPVAQRTWRKCRSATSAYQNSPHEWRVEREGQTFVRQMEASPLSFSLHCICTPSGLWYYTHQKIFKYHKKRNHSNDTYNIIVGYELILKCLPTAVNRVQSIFATRTLVLTSAWATCAHIGSVRLQWLHHGA